MPPQSFSRSSSSPPKVLNVAEKPSVARSLAGAFERMPGARESSGAGGRRYHRDNAAQVFTHDNVQFPYIFNQGSGVEHQHNVHDVRPHTMITTSVRGHLASTDFAPGYGWNDCDASVLLGEAPIQTYYADDKIELYNMLKQLARDVDAVILWLDCDREGEAIGDEVVQVCLEGNPRLQSQQQRYGNYNGNSIDPTNKIYRAKFSTVLFPEIQRALRTLGRNNMNLVHAVQARSELDLRIGSAFTRFQTLRIQKKFRYDANNNNDSSSVISYGPCQFPTLGFVVERWARIETFISEDFWFLELTLQVANAGEGGTIDDNNNNNNQERPITFTWKRQRLYDRLMTLSLYEACLDDGMAVVTQLSGRNKSKWRPVPLATVELQKRASKYLRIGSEVTMSAAEHLYQSGYISYPRTETERFRTEFQHMPLLQDFASLTATTAGDTNNNNNNGWGNANVAAQFSSYASKLLNENGFQIPRAGQHDDQAHPPITPCKAIDPNTIPDHTQRQIYILVVKHYLACCSRDATGRETTLTVTVATEEFNARGLMVEERNWLDIYHPWERWSTGQGELPRVEVGSRIRPNSLLMKQGQTTPPQLLSEVELISLMDRCGIGTDATIAEHIKTIVSRNYVVKNADQRFEPQPLGIALVEGYNAMGYQLNKPDLRRETEIECNLVARGQKTKDEIVGPILAKMKEIFEGSIREASKLDEAVGRRFARRGSTNDTTTVQASFSGCGTCSSTMALKRESGNHGGGGRGSDSVQYLVYCNTCSEAHFLPRNGKFQAKVDDSGDNTRVGCPICNFQVLSVTRGNGYEGNGYNVCPKCYNDPPPEYSGSGDGVTNLPCFKCSHPTCALAQGLAGDKIEIFACPFCKEKRIPGGKVTLRKNSRGTFMGCSNWNNARHKCSYTIWFPRGTQSATVDESDSNICNNCSTDGPVRKVSFVWKNGAVPPHVGRESTECVLCNTGFLEDVGIALPRMDRVGHRQIRRLNVNTSNIATSTNRHRSTSSQGGGSSFNNVNATNNHRGGGGGGRGGGAGAGGGSGIVCFRCNQPGHFANDCPNNSSSGSLSNNRRGGGGGVAVGGTGGGGNACYKCGLPGHFANECPNNNNVDNSFSRNHRSGVGSGVGGGNGSNVCYKCGQPGHFASNCTNGGSGDGGGIGGNKCYKCGQPGHFANQCPSR